MLAHCLADNIYLPFFIFIINLNCSIAVFYLFMYLSSDMNN